MLPPGQVKRCQTPAVSLPALLHPGGAQARVIPGSKSAPLPFCQLLCDMYLYAAFISVKIRRTEEQPANGDASAALISVFMRADGSGNGKLIHSHCAHKH